MAGPFGGAQHLVDEAFGPRRAGAADAPWPNAKIAIALAHGRAANRSLRPTVPETPLKLMENSSIAARDPNDSHAESQAISMARITTGDTLFSGHSSLVFPLAILHLPISTLLHPPLPHSRTAIIPSSPPT